MNFFKDIENIDETAEQEPMTEEQSKEFNKKAAVEWSERRESNRVEQIAASLKNDAIEVVMNTEIEIKPSTVRHAIFFDKYTKEFPQYRGILNGVSPKDFDSVLDGTFTAEGVSLLEVLSVYVKEYLEPNIIITATLTPELNDLIGNYEKGQKEQVEPTKKVKSFLKPKPPQP
jgi:hypothetical protein